ncbi:MAG: serine/threonine-protein kinase [Myxococcota bacterium]
MARNAPLQRTPPEGASQLGRRDAASLIAGQFEIVAPLSSSLTGRTYIGRHVELDRPVIIKLMHMDGSANVRARFEREARALARVSHHNVARLLAYGRTGDGRRYLVTEHVDGHSLGKAIERWGRLPTGRVLRILDQLAQALDAVHRAGLVHRNIKPGCIIIGETRDGRDLVKLTNFGLVRDAWPMADDRIGEGATRTRAMTGTPRYWAPEQVLGDQTDARTDIYAFGVLAFELLTGRSPFESTTTTGFAYQHVHQAPALRDRMGRLELRPELEVIIARCLAKHPDERYQSVAELRQALRAARPRIMRRRRTASERIVRQLRRPEVWVLGGVAFLASLLGALVG